MNERETVQFSLFGCCIQFCEILRDWRTVAIIDASRHTDVTSAPEYTPRAAKPPFVPGDWRKGDGAVPVCLVV